MANGRFSRPSQPQRNYNAERRSGTRIGGGWKVAGRAFSTIGKTLAQSSHSHKDATLKKHGAHVSGPFTKGGGVITSQKAKNWVRKMRFINPYKRRAIELMIEGHDPKKQWSPQQQGGILEEEFHKELAPKLKKEIGGKAGEQVVGELAALYAGKRGKRIQVEEMLEHLPRAKKYMRKEQMPVARQILKNEIVPFGAHAVGNRGITSEEILKVAKEVHGELDSKTGAEFESAFGIAREDSTASSPEAPTSKKVMGLREALGLQRFGKRPSGNMNGDDNQDNLRKAA